MIITNGKIITWDKQQEIIEGKAILIQGGRIIEIGDEKRFIDSYPGESIVNAHSQYIMPGNVCAHTHFYGAYARGMYIPGEPAADFPQILDKLWWPLDRSLDQHAVYLSAIVCLIEAIKMGTTTLFDHHASPSAIAGSLDAIADAVIQSGLRASLCYEVTDRNGFEQAEEGIRENLRFYQRLKSSKIDRLSACFGLHASLTLSEKSLELCRSSAPDDLGFHVHVAEHECDQIDSLSKTGLRVVHRLQKHGILGPRSIVVHAVHTNREEIDLLAASKTWVTHQPRSNMNNGVGLPETEAMMKAGIPVCLGNDGFLNGMWEEWKAAYLAHKLVHRDPRRMNGSDIIQMGVFNNRAMANAFFGNGPFGVIEPGALADLIFVDYQPYTPVTSGNLPWHVLFGFNDSMVTTTIVNGEVIMEDRKLVKLDEDRIYAEARAAAPRVWEKYWSQFKK